MITTMIRGDVRMFRSRTGGRSVSRLHATTTRVGLTYSYARTKYVPKPHSSTRARSGCFVASALIPY